MEKELTSKKSESKEVQILNYTPHTVNIVLPTGEKKDFPSLGNARCDQTTIPNGNISGIPITATSFGEVTGLPAEQSDIYYIVSRLVMQACPNRHDLLVPNEVVRDGEGKITGCKSLANN